jgi:large subunit ribosomal protein L31
MNFRRISIFLKAHKVCATILPMKKDTHPQDYRTVMFVDVTAGKSFLIGSTVGTEKTAKGDDGATYPVFEIEISSASHPFYTGQSKVIDTAGRVDKFKKRLAAAKKK